MVQIHRVDCNYVEVSEFSTFQECQLTRGVLQRFADAEKLIERETPDPSKDPTVGLYLGSHGGPRGRGMSLMSEVPLYTGRGS